MTFKIKINTFSLASGSFSILVLSLLLLLIDDHQTIIPITAQPSAENTNKKEDKKDGDGGITTIKTKINLNNIDSKNHDQLKLVSYLNGEGKITYIDLKESKNKINPKDNSLTVDLKFNKSNDISQVMFDDEYYVCGYVIDDKINTANTKSNLTLYDCDEGNISLTSTNKDTVKLFYTLKKFSESNALYNTNNPSTTKETPNEVKLRIDVPIHDNKKINDMYLVAMIKGEYQIKKIDAQQEIEKGDKKSSNERLSIPFIFDRKTEVGLIEPGDMFFGCVTSDEFPDQNSDCEKRIITDLSKPGQVCARLDSACK
ncbi:MAG TPA: hypothetical protein VFC05_15820 [Nitrososphaeraceae archaeon]|jgi:hypothetical protein|nr:hypothetical protein [Nitrososphaeraceae archaeon]